MRCPNCGSIKQLTPESRRTETSVWRRRVCKACHGVWLTQEHISAEVRMPAEAHQFLDKVMRHAPKYMHFSEDHTPQFDTSGLERFRW